MSLCGKKSTVLMHDLWFILRSIT